MEPGPPPEPLLLPVSLAGRWARDWRWARSLVGRGGMQVDPDGLRLTGAQTSVARGVLVLVVRLVALGGFVAGCGAAALTGIGLTVRTRTPEWLGAALVAIPLVLAGSVFVAWLGRRLLERPRSHRIPWAQVERLAAVGPTLELAARVEGRRIVGRFRPRRYTPEARTLLHQLRRGQAPAAAPDLALQPLRSRRLDQLGLLTLAALFTMAAAAAWPHLRPLALGPPTSGPAAGIPARLPATALEQAARPCPRGPADGPAVHNRREGVDLAWRRDPVPGWESVHALRLPDGALRLLGRSAEASGRYPGAFAEGGVALSLAVPAAAAAEVAAALSAGELEAALCGGHVARLDRSRDPGEAEGGPTLAVLRDGDDLVVEVHGDDTRGLRLLAARQRDRSRLDWFDRCELAVDQGALVLPRISGPRRLRGFFGGSRDEARVLLLPAGEAAQVRARLGTAEAVACVEVDALAWGGPALALATTARGAEPLAEAAADLTRALPLPTTGADALVEGLDDRYAAVRARLAPRTRAEWQAVDQGFLDGLAWGAVLETLSVQHDLPQIERIRQRLSGADREGNLGELFLLRLAEELLERVPPAADGAAYDARIEVAEAWLAVDPGTTWTTDGRTIRVPSPEVAAYYQVVGHYLLVDVARRVEARMEQDLAFRLTGLPTRWRLENHGINLDIEKSSAQKALEAWVTGDFEYLGDRALARLAEQVADQAAAIQAAADARYQLAGQWSAADGAARTARLRRDDQELGWVALYDQAAVALRFHHVGGAGISRQGLGGDRALLATAGSYVTGAGRTSGLSARDGTVDNFLISNTMDGLVLIDARGALSMLDMRHGGVLPGQQVPIRPLERLADLHLLLRWIEDHGASAFQTHLLGFGGQLTIDEAKASGELRERRLLVLAAHRGHPIVAVIDLPGTPKVSLYEAAVIAVQALRTPADQGGPALDVISVANLDVGSYNALEAWADDGTTLRRSWKPLGETMNLVSVQRRAP